MSEKEEVRLTEEWERLKPRIRPTDVQAFAIGFRYCYLVCVEKKDPKTIYPSDVGSN